MVRNGGREPLEHKLIAESKTRMLKPGGRMLLQMLTGGKKHATPVLSGTNSEVKFVLAKDDLMQLASTSPFPGLRLLQYNAYPCFVHGGNSTSAL